MLNCISTKHGIIFNDFESLRNHIEIVLHRVEYNHSDLWFRSSYVFCLRMHVPFFIYLLSNGNISMESLIKEEGNLVNIEVSQKSSTRWYVYIWINVTATVSNGHQPEHVHIINHAKQTTYNVNAANIHTNTLPCIAMIAYTHANTQCTKSVFVNDSEQLSNLV